ncbi:MAG: 4Fe-4S dicluster domain-containing protein [Christensenellales bacterium]
MRKFDTKVQHLKYSVLREVAHQAFSGTLYNTVMDIPRMIVPGSKPTMRCCVYKERAILTERVKLAMGGDRGNPNVIEVIDIACDECPVGGFEITEACRGCIAHRCEETCKMNAITFDSHQKAHIDKTKCVECGRCAKVCPYSAISDNKRPCEKACKVKAIKMSEEKSAQIDNEKCIACGACVYMCPFGAIMDKSHILKVVDLIKNNSGKNNLFAVVAPSVSSQFTYAKLGQVISGIKRLGFAHVAEAALGADMVAFSESKELAQKGFLMSSCCPAFVDYVDKNFPALAESISKNLSPMAAIAKHIKEKTPDAKIVFIGPCTAKKMELKKETVSPYVDSVITFEELQALLDSCGIDITALEEDALDSSSYFGRIFARSGGLTEAIGQALKEHGLADFTYKPVSCDGIEACKIALLKASKGAADVNFIEGMACTGGCIGGAGCLTHEEKNKGEVDRYGSMAIEKKITGAVAKLDQTN